MTTNRCSRSACCIHESNHQYHHHHRRRHEEKEEDSNACSSTDNDNEDGQPQRDEDGLPQETEQQVKWKVTPWHNKAHTTTVVIPIHRVHTTGDLLQPQQQDEDDYVTAKQLTPSAKDRLVKRFSSQQQQQQTTEQQHHATTTTPGFYGAYANLRKKLDYSYHVHYRKERQWLHDAIIEDLLLKHQQLDEQASLSAYHHPDSSLDSTNDYNNNKTIQNQQQNIFYDYHQGRSVILPKYPWLVFMVGVHGAAKHSTVRKLIDAGYFPLLSLVCVDTDDLRRYLPEYATYYQQAPDTVDRRTRKEAGYISETLALAALQAGRNVVFYCSIKDTAWYKDSFIPFYRKQFHGLKVALIHVTADPSVALARARQRAAALQQPTLDEAAFLENLNVTIPRACRELRSEVDYYAKICNNGGTTDLQLLEGGGDSGGADDWTAFTQVFDQRARVLSLSYPERFPPTPVVHTHHKRISSIRRFCTLESSEDNHAADDMEFYGPFADIRQSLDYSFHQNYTFERQHFQDAIIREFLDAPQAGQETCRCALPSRPWAVFTGKSVESVNVDRSWCLFLFSF